MQAQQTLVKYNNPILVSTTKETRGKSKGGPGKRSQLTPTEDILNSILPPREWTEDGQLWVQYVSSNPATRLDVITLQDQLDKKLLQRQARETGICPIREELYAQCFDELIRELTINCAERGLLLLRVRDEIRMTIASYQTLYESSIAFGMRKALQSEQKKAEMEQTIKAIEQENHELDQTVFDLTAKCLSLDKKVNEKWDEDERKHKDEIGVLRQHNQSLKEELEGHLSLTK